MESTSKEVLLTTYKSGKVEERPFSLKNAQLKVRAAKHIGNIAKIEKAEATGTSEEPTYKVKESIWTSGNTTSTVNSNAAEIAELKAAAEAKAAEAETANAAADALAQENNDLKLRLEAAEKAAAEAKAAAKAAEKAAGKGDNKEK